MPSIDDHFAPSHATSQAMPAIEAHHKFRFDGDPAALARSVRIVAGAETPDSPEDLDILQYAHAIQAHSAERPAPHDGLANEAWLRWSHACLTVHHPGMRPRVFKPMNGVPQGDLSRAGTPPSMVAGTLRAMFAEFGSRLPAGGWRATLSFLVIVQMHPFVNGNKRLARFVANRELAAAGLMPHVNVPGLNQKITVARETLRRTGDAMPIALLLASASRQAALLDAPGRLLESR